MSEIANVPVCAKCGQPSPNGNICTTCAAPTCGICGGPMPEGEEMFNYHGYSGDCPTPPLSKVSDYVAWLRFVGATDDPHRRLELCDSDAPGAFKVYRR